MFYLFAFWTTALWLRSMVVTWTGSGSLPFKLVHTVLAIGFFILAYLVWKVARSRTGDEPALSPEVSGVGGSRNSG
jgi:hypothetical protein